jgi:MFS family permease
VRKTFVVTGVVTAGIFLLCTVIATTKLAVVFLMLTGFALGASTSNLWAITQRLAGKQAVGRWCGIQLFIGNSSGIVSPAVAGYLLDRTGQFFWPFLIVSFVLWMGALSWIFIVRPVEPVDWAPKEHLQTSLLEAQPVK